MEAIRKSRKRHTATDPPLNRQHSLSSVASDKMKATSKHVPASVSKRQYACVLLFTSMSYCSSTSITSLLSQYVYHRYAVQMGLPGGGMNDNSTQCTTNTSDPFYHLQMQVQQVTSQLNLKSSLIIGCIHIVAVLIMGAYSDRIGRRLSIIIPLTGVSCNVILFTMWMVWELPMWMYIVAQLPGAFTGAYSAIIAATFSLISDSSWEKERSLYIAILDVTLGICFMLSCLLTGWLIRWFGFHAPFYAMAALFLCSSIFVFGVPETSPMALQREERRNVTGADENSLCSSATGDTSEEEETLLPHRRPPAHQQGSMTPWRMFTMSLHVLVVDSHRGLLLSLILTSMFTYHFYWFGSGNISTLILLNQPFCWNSVQMGVYFALGASLCQVGTVLVISLLRKRVGETWLIALGFISIILGLTGAAVATRLSRPECNYLMITCAGIGMFASLVPPMSRTVISKLVSEYEQGAVFGCMASLEALAMMLGQMSCSAIYEATVAFFPGFTNLVLAALLAIGLLLTKIFYCLTRGSTREDRRVLLSEDAGDS